jgi:predicted AlkP superfamily phosphohydrolase/phosphomutase
VARDPRGEDVIADLAEGEWSDWALESFDTVDGVRRGPVRFKLERLSPDAGDVALYATQVMDIDHYTTPPSAGYELYETAGAFITDIGWEGLGHSIEKCWFNESVLADMADYQHQWFVRAVQHLTGTRDWSLCMLQAHCIDCANHYCLNYADPSTSPDKALQPRFLAFLETLYESLDRMLGAIRAGADEKTTVVVVSDHGGLPSKAPVDIARLLRDAGLLAEDENGRDWSRTRAYPHGGMFVNVNLVGREPKGVVAPEQFDRVCDEVKAALHAYRDPETGLHPFNLVLRKTDMRYVGLYGDPEAKKIGDVVCTVREPFGSTHGFQLSTARHGLASNGSLLILSGAGIRKGITLDRTVWLPDITPTLCRLIGVAPPRDAQGAVLYQALEEYA